jgi:ferritin-like metal-binding protein YciE
MTMPIKNLDDLFLHGLKDVYFAENHIVKALPKMIKKTSDSKLQQLLEAHLKETEGQVERLRKAFKSIDQRPAGHTCPAIEGITKEAEEMMGEIKDGDTRDAAIISAAQAVEHYEITRYGTLVSWAKMLGHSDAEKLLAETLDEEYGADRKLSKIAESRLNAEAA